MEHSLAVIHNIDGAETCLVYERLQTKTKEGNLAKVMKGRNVMAQHGMTCLTGTLTSWM